MTRTQAILELYETGYSTYNLADMTGMTRNAVQQLLDYYNATRPSMGLDYQQRVYEYYKGLGHDVVQHRGDYHCDLTLSGREYDVKSASPNKGYYRFQIWCKKTRKYSKIVNLVDYLLITKDNDNLYLFSGRNLSTYQQMLTIKPTDIRLTYITRLP